MSGVIVDHDPCLNCHHDLVFGDHDCNTGEHIYSCAACGNLEKFMFRRDSGKIVYKNISIPAEQVALTVRINKRGAMPVVWDMDLPAWADTDFISLFLSHKQEEINTRYPNAVLPDLGAIARQFGAYAFCAVERRIPHPSRKDNLPYIRMSYIGNRFEVRRSNDGDELIVSKRKYIIRHRIGSGVISLVDIQGNRQFWRAFSPDTTARRAQRLWAAHVNAETDFQLSYMTLMHNGTLQVLQGSLSALECE